MSIGFLKFNPRYLSSSLDIDSFFLIFQSFVRSVLSIESFNAQLFKSVKAPRGGGGGGGLQKFESFSIRTFEACKYKLVNNHNDNLHQIK